MAAGVSHPHLGAQSNRGSSFQPHRRFREPQLDSAAQKSTVASVLKTSLSSDRGPYTPGPMHPPHPSKPQPLRWKAPPGSAAPHVTSKMSGRQQRAVKIPI